MQFSLLSVSALLFSLAAAQTTRSTACAAQPVLDACMATSKGIINSCVTTDYSCLCTAYTALLTCYDQCPNDTGVTAASSTRASYCAYVTTTAAISRPVSSWVSSATGVAAATTASGNSEAAEVTGTGTGTATSSSASNTATGNAGVKGALTNAGGLLAGVAGLAAFLL
ncbi:hypothetical protein PVAG01_03602 [Phlyctema vagabunda]|uniref:GPI anchored serine-threonine rich protein n=1 Tax=Phlyctema vagabunda TaxID=108571 RepID=A0ABR4PLV0_9HELO